MHTRHSHELASVLQIAISCSNGAKQLISYDVETKSKIIQMGLEQPYLENEMLDKQKTNFISAD